ncbi:MAG: acyl-[acyl-carrier-protein]--UDP-N-acetylglucosamine O-acyltransferase, partial [Alphaproteobacteria bacterium]|nr:acyl-[acyl-carrier-protein]--UDP-N-acetylglucosamine O-acyltransferase [Alphaproteobacteria bacterium]
MAKIHPTAIVEDGAALGEGVQIGPYCMVSAEANL